MSPLLRRLEALEAGSTSDVPLVTLCGRADGVARIGRHQQQEGENEEAFIERAQKAMRQATGRPVVVLDAGDADL
jgi:hypothetical protein